MSASLPFSATRPYHSRTDLPDDCEEPEKGLAMVGESQKVFHSVGTTYPSPQTPGPEKHGSVNERRGRLIHFLISHN